MNRAMVSQQFDKQYICNAYLGDPRRVLVYYVDYLSIHLVHQA